MRLRITAAAETIVRSGHPWLFADSIHETNRAGQSGELAVIYDRKDKFLAVGLFDPDSPIRVRILHAGKPQTIDAAWWQTRLEQALARRRRAYLMRKPPATASFTARATAGPASCWIVTARRSC